MKLDRLKADYGRYLAIKERQKKDSLHGMLEAFELKDEFVAALPGLLKVCDAYEELLIADAILGSSQHSTAVSYSEIYAKAEKKIKELLG